MGLSVFFSWNVQGLIHTWHSRWSFDVCRHLSFLGVKHSRNNWTTQMYRQCNWKCIVWMWSNSQLHVRYTPLRRDRDNPSSARRPVHPWRVPRPLHNVHNFSSITAACLLPKSEEIFFIKDYLDTSGLQDLKFLKRGTTSHLLWTWAPEM